MGDLNVAYVRRRVMAVGAVTLVNPATIEGAARSRGAITLSAKKITTAVLTCPPFGWQSQPSPGPATVQVFVGPCCVVRWIPRS